LPGRHHTSNHWSTVYDGKTWLSGADAVAYLLSLSGDSPALIPEEATRIPPRRHTAARSSVSPCTTRRQTGNLSVRIAARLRKLPNLGGGEGRDDVGYRFACWLVRDLNLPDGIALDWLCIWDANNRPPKGRERLQEILKSAHAYGRHAVGCGLSPSPAGNIHPTRRPGHATIKFTVEL
jgi:hypothetical protein